MVDVNVLVLVDVDVIFKWETLIIKFVGIGNPARV